MPSRLLIFLLACLPATAAARGAGRPRVTRPIVTHLAAPAARPAATAPAPAAQAASFVPPQNSPAQSNWSPAGPSGPAALPRQSPRFQPPAWSRQSRGIRRVADENPQPPPPYTYMPGALIRSEGLGYRAEATNDARMRFVEAGDRITQNPNESLSLGGIVPFIGPPDSPPGSGSASGRNAITPHDSPGRSVYQPSN